MSGDIRLSSRYMHAYKHPVDVTEMKRLYRVRLNQRLFILGDIAPEGFAWDKD